MSIAAHLWLLQEAARRQNATRLADYAVDRRISFLPAVCSTWGRIDAELLRLLCHHAHRESEEFFKLTGQLAQPNQDSVFSKRPAFFNSLKNKVRHVIAKASALKVNLNLHATRTPIESTPLTSPPLLTHPPPPPLAHDCKITTLPKVPPLASRSFSIFVRLGPLW